MSFDLYSQTPASNDIANYFQTGMAPSNVKNAGWDIMADLAQFMSLPTAGGTANAQTITNVRACGAWFTGMWVCWMPEATNTAAMTIAPNGLAAKNVFCNGAAALAGQVVLGIPAIGRYDGTQVQLINPQRSTGSFTITLSQMASGGTGTINYAIDSSGHIASIWAVNTITGTSNGTSMLGSGIPAVLQTLISQNFNACSLQDNGATIGAGLLNTTTSTWTFGKIAPSGGGFTASGGKGISVGFQVIIKL